MSGPWFPAAVVVLSVVFAAVVVDIVRRVALRHEVLDVPNPRSSHTAPVPRGGGVAIVIPVLAALAVATALSDDPAALLVIGLTALGVAVVGLVDDIWSLPTWVRFIAYLVAAISIVLGVGSYDVVELPLAGTVRLGVLGVPITVLWVAGLVNAYNFMDGIDGIAAAQGIATGLWWAVILGPASPIGIVALVAAAASIGFLRHNLPPARIFMGDVGSTFLGLLFAAIPVAEQVSSPRIAVAGILLVWPFVFDATLTLCRRLLRGEAVWSAHRSHLYQRLVIAGWSHGQVSTLYLVMAAACGGLGWWWAGFLDSAGWLVPVAVAAMSAALWWLVRSLEARTSGDSATNKGPL